MVLSNQIVTSSHFKTSDGSTLPAMISTTLKSHMSLASSGVLTYLNLSAMGLTGFVPLEISLLSQLVSLDLSKNSFLTFRNHDFNMLVHNITKLENMVLHYINLSL
ncbi:hypothetical protein Goshw_027116, partial [Gossypium schwendimanii]|nr:hypothetical protein [Gossypium schwendimanii]